MNKTAKICCFVNKNGKKQPIHEQNEHIFLNFLAQFQPNFGLFLCYILFNKF